MCLTFFTVISDDVCFESFTHLKDKTVSHMDIEIHIKVIFFFFLTDHFFFFAREFPNKRKGEGGRKFWTLEGELYMGIMKISNWVQDLECRKRGTALVLLKIVNVEWYL